MAGCPHTLGAEVQAVNIGAVAVDRSDLIEVEGSLLAHVKVEKLGIGEDGQVGVAAPVVLRSGIGRQRIEVGNVL